VTFESSERAGYDHEGRARWRWEQVKLARAEGREPDWEALGLPESKPMTLDSVLRMRATDRIFSAARSRLAEAEEARRTRPGLRGWWGRRRGWWRRHKARLAAAEAERLAELGMPPKGSKAREWIDGREVVSRREAAQRRRRR
jgi:hypothetical protein